MNVYASRYEGKKGIVTFSWKIIQSVKSIRFVYNIFHKFNWKVNFYSVRKIRTFIIQGASEISFVT